MNARTYFRHHAVDGRAVIRYKRPDMDGVCDPQLWLCVLDQTLVACDNELYLSEIAPRKTVRQVVAGWRQYRQQVLLEKQRARRALRDKLVTGCLDSCMEEAPRHREEEPCEHCGHQLVAGDSHYDAWFDDGNERDGWLCEQVDGAFEMWLAWRARAEASDA